MYLLGMMSIVRKTLRLDGTDIADALRFRPAVAAALQGKENEYRHLIDLAEALEQGRWEAMTAAADRLRIHEGEAAELLAKACAWAGTILEHAGSTLAE